MEELRGSALRGLGLGFSAGDARREAGAAVDGGTRLRNSDVYLPNVWPKHGYMSAICFIYNVAIAYVLVVSFIYWNAGTPPSNTNWDRKADQLLQALNRGDKDVKNIFEEVLPLTKESGTLGRVVEVLRKLEPRVVASHANAITRLLTHAELNVKDEAAALLNRNLAKAEREGTLFDFEDGSEWLVPLLAGRIICTSLAEEGPPGSFVFARNSQTMHVKHLNEFQVSSSTTRSVFRHGLLRSGRSLEMK